MHHWLRRMDAPDKDWQLTTHVSDSHDVAPSSKMPQKARVEKLDLPSIHK